MIFHRAIAVAILRELLETDKPVSDIPGITKEEFKFHSAMLRENGMIEGRETGSKGNNYLATRVTWSGYSRLYDYDEALGKEFDPKLFVRNMGRS